MSNALARQATDFALDDPGPPIVFAAPPPDVASEGAGHGLSMRQLETLDGFVEDLERVEQSSDPDRVDELRKIFANVAADLGFKHFTYHIVRSTSVNVSGRLGSIISTYPDTWVRHYFRHGYLDEDPVVARLLQDRQPFAWSDMCPLEDLTRRQRQLFDEAHDAGIVNGVTIPIHAGGDVAGISLVPDRSGDDGSRLLRGHHALMRLMALRYHTAARAVLLEKTLTGESRRRRTLLSPRERQVLEWTARGKSSWEIAVVLGISPKSVEFHVEGAKRKLQVFNRTHAVAKAIMLGLLSFE